MSNFLNISTDTTLGGNSPSDMLPSSQKAIKTYVDNNIPIVDQTYTATSTHAQSGVAVANAIAPKQDALVSGTNIKTINGTSLLGSGNIVIESSSTPDVDNSTISYNSSEELQTIAVKNKRDNSILPIWQGTELQWNQGEATPWYYWQTDVTAGWTSGGNLPISSRWQFIASDGRRIVAQTQSYQYSAYSTDGGETWVQGGNLPDGGGNIAYGNGRFVSISGLSGNTVYSTDGGETWVQGGNLPFSPGDTTAPIIYAEDRFIIACRTGTNTAYSTDGGETWVQGGNLPFTGTVYDMAYGNGIIVAVSGSNAGAYSTDNGQTWIDFELSGDISGCSVAYGNNRFIITGKRYYFAHLLQVYYSTNGYDWIKSDTELAGFNNDYTKVVSNGSIALVINFYLSSNSDVSAYSTDNGETWELLTMQNGKWSNISFKDDKFVVIAYASDSSSIFSSSYHSCYTDTANPTTSSTVYSAPAVTSSYTISSVTSGAITLSDNNTYYYNQSGNQYTYQPVGTVHPDWLCNINNVGVKLGNTVIATAGGGSSYTAGDGIDITSNVISVDNTVALKSDVPVITDTYSSTSSDGMSGKAVASAISSKADISALSDYVPTSRTINNKALSSNISLTASDVGALPSSTVIPTVNDATLTITQGGTTKGTFTANASSNVTIALDSGGSTYTAGTGIDITNDVISVDGEQVTAVDLPVVNDAILTIQKNGTSVATFTANASSNVTANISVPTKTSDLTNDDGFITGITSSDVTTALGYTPYNSSNPSGYQANVIETVKVNGTALTPSSKAVDVTVPTKVSDLTNDSGFISGITSTDVTTALGYTPYDSSNPNGYTTNVGTVTSVNNVSPVNGNVTISIPVVDQSYSGTSTNAQSGVAVKSAIDSAISSVYKAAGSVAYASLPTPSSSNEGYVYNVTDAFTTDSRFVEGSGKTYPAGTNVVIIDAGSSTYKFDVLVGMTDLSGYVPTSRTINGKALSNDITLAATDVGALPSSTVIPTVNDATLTIQKNGTSVATFTANASSNVTANITVPTNTNELTNGAGFITGITSSDVTTALGYTPYNSTNPSGYQANVIETVKVNGTALTPSSKAVDISVPTETTVTGWGFTKNAGTVTSVNNTSPDANGNVTISIPSISNLADKDLSNLSSTGNAKFQAPLVSGTNIKTINNTSLLGSGNISIGVSMSYDSSTETLTFA